MPGYLVDPPTVEEQRRLARAFRLLEQAGRLLMGKRGERHFIEPWEELGDAKTEIKRVYYDTPGDVYDLPDPKEE